MSSLKEVFKYDDTENNNNIVDYEVFSNKDLLDSLRTKIVENIIDLKGCGSVLSRSAACDFMAEKGGKL